MKLLKRLDCDQGGSVFVEVALLIIGVALAVAPFMLDLGETLGSKVEEIRDEVEQVGV